MGSQGWPFRIQLWKWPKTPPSGDTSMTSFPSSKWASLSWKRYVIKRKLLLNTTRMSESYLLNSSSTVFQDATLRRYNNDVMFCLCENVISYKLFVMDEKRLLNTNRKSGVALSESTCDSISGSCLAERQQWRQTALHLATCFKNFYMPNFLKNLQIIMQKTLQFINAVNGVSHSYKIENIFWSFFDVSLYHSI